MKKSKTLKIGLVASAALLGLLAGCASHVAEPAGEVYASPQSLYVETGVAAQDDYVYYPAYQVYYSSYRHQYIYQDGRSWVSRPAPPHVAAKVVLASPSVNVDFHDSPANHHAQIVKQYPKQWTPPESGPDNHQDRHVDDQRKN